jgi:TPR repeat protein
MPVEPSATSPEQSKTTTEQAAAAPATTPTTEPTVAPPTAAKTETPAETKTLEKTAPENAPPAPEKSTTASVEKPEKAKPARAKAPEPAEPAASPGEALFVQGQRYLYGTGVSPNCDLALKSLLSAAARSNPRAQSTLGTMYFTGHCVTRDLPSAYRWFAKALRQDPNNSRLEQNLSVVWKQMTPGERQMATRAE